MSHLLSIPKASRFLNQTWRVSLFLIFLSGFSLCAADWQPGQGFRSRTLTLPANGRTFLQRLTPAETGINFTNFLSDEKALENSMLTLGAGVAAGDVDGDGLCDLYFIGTQKPNALYRNLGNWKFEDITASAGVACAGQFSSAAVFADVDGDGDLDLLVTSIGHGTRLLINDGKGHFTEPPDSGLIKKFGATSMALADVDGNGTLDLYVANYSTTKLEDRPNSRFSAKKVDGKVVLTAINGVPMTSPELTNRYVVDRDMVVRELGEPDILYLNDGHGKFKPVSWTDGTFLDEQGKPLTQLLYDFGLSVMFRDFTGDGTPDIYICNDLFPPDRIWVNDGKGHFRAMSNLAVRNTCRFAMGIDFADINRDGYDDFFVVDMLSRDHMGRKTRVFGVPSYFHPVGVFDDRLQYKKNTLFLNRGDGTFAEMAQYAGLEATEWSWMPAFLDVDLDGYEDVLVTTGHYRDSLNADQVEQILQERKRRKLTDAEHREVKKRLYSVLKHPNLAFRNKGDLTFEDKGKDWGFDYIGISQGMCLADLDNDGDLDVIVNHQNDLVGIYRNETIAPRVAVRLKGKAPNTRGIGAKIKVVGGPVPQSQEMIAGGRYLSGDDNVRMFAAASAAGGMSIEVTWRNGSVSLVKDAQPNWLYEIDETGAASKKSNPPLSPIPLFSDVSTLLNHSHVDEGYNDFERQPLLPKRLSQLGPGVSWYDVDGDGWDDLIVGGGGGGHIAVFRNEKNGAFKPLEKSSLSQPNPRDQTTILGWTKRSGERVLLAGSSNYEDAQPSGSCVREFDFNKETVKETLPPWECSTGPLAMGDWDGDGNLDLFVGGRVMPGKYPDEPFSLLFQGKADGSGFTLDKDAVKQFFQAGMISGAVITDLDGDGLGELVLACEWGPVRVFRWELGKWREHTADLGFDQYRGWWNGVTAGDFDGDGKMDIVASNWGRNTKYQSERHHPLRIYYGDWRTNGMFDCMEAYADEGLKKIVPWCTYGVALSLPWVAEQFPSFASFGRAGVDEILGARAKATKMFMANWLETTVFLNRGDHFEARILPPEAQLSPAFGVSVADVDGDGNEDIFFSQNFFALDGDTPRYDAGRGLWLRGDGQGNFKAMSGQESGVTVYGEQRGCAVSDYDADGRVDLVVSQNGAQTKLYHNDGAKPGLRIRLAGPPGNPDGIGASIRLSSAGKQSPAREVRCGSGYWSQESAVQVMAVPGENVTASIRWPGGQTTKSKIPSEAHEVSISYRGIVKVLR